MFGLILMLHSLLRWFLLAAVVARIGRAVYAQFQHAPFGQVDRRMSLVLMILTDLQVTFGLVLFAVSPTIRQALADPGAAMKNSALRLLFVEHPVMMIVAAVLIHVSHVVGKRATPENPPHLKVLALVLIAFGLMLSRIPW